MISAARWHLPLFGTVVGFFKTLTLKIDADNVRVPKKTRLIFRSGGHASQHQARGISFL